jgi:hypothetical protein
VAPRALILLAGALLALAVPAVAGGEACVIVDDFARGTIGEFPPDWKLRKDSGRGVYTLQAENGRRFLRAASHGLGIQAARPFSWDVRTYPVLAWSWRPLRFPAGADERRSKTNDSTLAVYAVFPHSMVSLRAVKYVWSLVVPVGTHLSSNMGLTQVRVERRGADADGRWVEQR